MNSRRAQGYSASSRRAQSCDVFTQGFNQSKKKEREFNNKSQMSSLKKSKLGSRTQACRSQFGSGVSRPFRGARWARPAAWLLTPRHLCRPWLLRRQLSLSRCASAALLTAMLTAQLNVAPLTVANPRDPAHRKRGVTRRQRAQRVRHSAQRVRHSEQPSTLSTSNKPQRTPSGCKRSLQRQRQRQRCSPQRQRQRWPIAAPADRYRRLLQPRLHVTAAFLQARRHLMATISHSAAIAEGHGGATAAGPHGWMMSPTGKNIVLEDGEVIPFVPRARSGRGNPTRGATRFVQRRSRGVP